MIRSPRGRSLFLILLALASGIKPALVRMWRPLAFDSARTYSHLVLAAFPRGSHS